MDVVEFATSEDGKLPAMYRGFRFRCRRTGSNDNNYWVWTRYDINDNNYWVCTRYDINDNYYWVCTIYDINDNNYWVWTRYDINDNNYWVWTRYDINDNNYWVWTRYDINDKNYWVWTRYDINDNNYWVCTRYDINDNNYWVWTRYDINDNNYWVWTRYDIKCKSTLTTNEAGVFTKWRGEYDHPPDVAQCEVTKAISTMRKRAREKPLVQVQQIYNAEAAKPTSSGLDFVTNIPRLHSVKHGEYNQRHLQLANLPTRREDV